SDLVRGNLKIGGIFVVSTSINDGFGTLIKDHFKNIGLKDFVVSIVLIPLFLFVLLINIYLDKKYRKNFYKEPLLINKLKKNGFRIIKNFECYGGINTLIIAEAV
ncbi:MAG: hypothetical protein PHT36_03045, partial [Patescibacteria group bacterium]|nr:hypothetical protein [Patescibacteria group bacterium]